MHNNKFTKETLWAVSIIIVCMLTACFLFIRTNIKNSEIKAVSNYGNTIILQDFSTSAVESSDTELPESFSETNNTNQVSTELVAQTNESTFNAETIFSEPEQTITQSPEQSNTIDSDSKETIDITPSPDYDCPIDFASYWEINKDVYAWINIPGTIIDYPILQHETDDSYYLNYNIDGTEGFPGCIYTEKVNAKDFMDNNTAIYGHELRNGTMFTDLHKFRDKDFFAEHDIMYIYTPTRQLTYTIFAAYLYDNRHLMNSFDFSDQNVYANYLDEIRNGDFEEMNLRSEIEIADTDKIITLITCTREQPEKRVYVQAVLQP